MSNVQIPIEVAKHILTRLRAENAELKRMRGLAPLDAESEAAFGFALKENEADLQTFEVAVKREEIASLSRGTWPEDCVQRAFVQGGKWWQYHQNKATAFPSEVDQMEEEAIRRYGEPKGSNG